MRSTILFKYLIVSQIILNKNIIHTFQKFKSFQDSSQVHSSRTILLAAFQIHFILKGSMEVRQTYYITNKLFKKQKNILLFLIGCIFFWELGAVASNYCTYTGKNYYRKKRYSRLAGYVFWRVQITTGKNYNRKKGTVVWPTVEMNLR